MLSVPIAGMRIRASGLFLLFLISVFSEIGSRDSSCFDLSEDTQVLFQNLKHKLHIRAFFSTSSHSREFSFIKSYLVNFAFKASRNVSAEFLYPETSFKDSKTAESYQIKPLPASEFFTGATGIVFNTIVVESGGEKLVLSPFCQELNQSIRNIP